MVDKECNLRAGVYKVQTFGLHTLDALGKTTEANDAFAKAKGVGYPVDPSV